MWSFAICGNKVRVESYTPGDVSVEVHSCCNKDVVTDNSPYSLHKLSLRIINAINITRPMIVKPESIVRHVTPDNLKRTINKSLK